MKPKTLKILIVGIAMFIFCPILGWILTMAGLFHAVSTMQQPQATDIHQLISQIFASYLPLFIGIVGGAVGAFLTLYALITHFFRAKPDA